MYRDIKIPKITRIIPAKLLINIFKRASFVSPSWKSFTDSRQRVENVVNASYEDLMNLDGIGIDIADGIRNALSEEQAEYK